MPKQVTAQIDPTVKAERTILIDKTKLPSGSTIDSANGDINVPTSIAL